MPPPRGSDGIQRDETYGRNEGSSPGGAGHASFLASSLLGFLDTVNLPASVETATTREGRDSRARTLHVSPGAPSEKLIDVFYRFALADPSRELFDWLDDKGVISNSYSRGELWNQGRILADRLERDGIKRGDFVMIVYP